LQINSKIFFEKALKNMPGFLRYFPASMEAGRILRDFFSNIHKILAILIHFLQTIESLLRIFLKKISRFFKLIELSYKLARQQSFLPRSGFGIKPVVSMLVMEGSRLPC